MSHIIVIEGGWLGEAIAVMPLGAAS